MISSSLETKRSPSVEVTIEFFPAPLFLSISSNKFSVYLNIPFVVDMYKLSSVPNLIPVMFVLIFPFITLIIGFKLDLKKKIRYVI
jgi:hypothetical protein